MLTITDINGNTEGLTGYKGLKRTRNVNGEKTLSFIVLPTFHNQHSFDMVQEESIIEFDGEEYRIKQMSEKPRGPFVFKEVSAIHTFFDLIDDRQYDTYTGSMTFDAALNFVLGSTDYTWDIIDTFYAQDFDNFGNDNLLALFQELLKRYGAEFTIDGTHLTFRTKIGNATDFQFRYNYNIKTLTRSVTTNNLSTYIKGFGKKNEDGTYAVQSEYTSPNVTIFGVRHAKPVYDERYTTVDGLNDRLLAELKDTPEVAITVDFIDMRRAGFPYDVPNEGDDVFLIYEPLNNLELETRIMDITEEFTEFNPYPIKTEVTLANYRRTMADQFIEFSRTQKTVSDIMEGNKKLPYSVLDDAVKRATEALQSAQTELEFNNGIIARSKDDPNNLVLLNSAGVGISTDGGATFSEAITYLGVNTSVLTAGQIKTNNVQIIGEDNLFYWDGNYLIAIDPNDPNKFARMKAGEFYVAKGAMIVERPDGYKLINNGIANFDFAIDAHDPPFIGSNVSQYGWWRRTLINTSYGDFNFYSYRHTGRYLRIQLNGGSDAGGGQKVAIFDMDGTTKLGEYSNGEWVGNTNQAGRGSLDITIDLGTPTGNLRSFYIRFMSTGDGTSQYTYLRLLRKWLEG